jgi:hypothetical protein
MKTQCGIDRRTGSPDASAAVGRFSGSGLRSNLTKLFATVRKPNCKPMGIRRHYPSITFSRHFMPVLVMKFDVCLPCLLDQELSVFRPKRRVTTQKNVGNDTAHSQLSVS